MSSSPSEQSHQGSLFGAVLARGPVADTTSDGSWLRAMLDAEAALSSACAEVDLVPSAAAEAVIKACADEAAFDVAALGAAAAGAGNPVVPLVRAIEGLAGPSGAAALHLGATSQDILDTAMVLVARRSVAALLPDLLAAADAAAGLARRHRDTAMVGRTLLQQAAPTTFGLKAAGWALALDHAAERLTFADSALPVQLGGAVGTLQAYGSAAPEVVAAMAGRLGLQVPLLPWHTARGPLADLAGALGATAGALGKIALDVCLLAQSEIAEVSEGTPGRGGSSAMPHKHNPVAAISARAATIRTPGLVATMLAAMAHEHERAAGPWHAEWLTLADLLQATGSAAAWICDCLTHLRVDTEAMQRNLAAVGGELAAANAAAQLTPALGRSSAHDLVSAAVERARTNGSSLAKELADDPGCELNDAQLRELSSIGTGQAGPMVDRALAGRSR